MRQRLCAHTNDLCSVDSQLAAIWMHGMGVYTWAHVLMHVVFKCACVYWLLSS